MIYKGINDIIEAVDPSVFSSERVLQFGVGNLFKKLLNLGINWGYDITDLDERLVIVNNTPLLSHPSLKASDPTISRILNLKEHWHEILVCAANPDLDMIIINRNALGKYVFKANIDSVTPLSFPILLLSVLYERFKYFNGDLSKGLIIITTNRDQKSSEDIESIVLELAHLYNIDPLFLDWTENANRFYSWHI